MESGRALHWLVSILRGLASRRKDLVLPPISREVTPRWLDADLVPVIGAHDEHQGALGVLRIKDGTDCLADPDPIQAGEGPRVAACAGIRIACTPFAELMPNAPRPEAALDVRHLASGDSVALPAAMAALLRLFGCSWPADLVATGGIDVQTARFLPVPESTLIGKARAARAWGFRRLGVICKEDSMPSEIEGLQVCPLPDDPARLGLALVTLSGVEPGEAVLARALTVFDQRVGRGIDALEHILEATDPFVDSASSIVSHVAHDMRSRAYLHAGRSEDAERELHTADGLLGEGWHPEGRLRDVLRYQGPAHRAVVTLDLGEWGDDHPVHRQVDGLIGALDTLWTTRHERLMRIFLANTRARRHEYLGRLHGDVSRFERAWADLTRDRDHWDHLLEDFARGELRRSDTDRARIENQLTDVAFSRFLIEGSVPESWARVMSEIHSKSRLVVGAESIGSTDAFRCEFNDGRTSFVGGNPFDAISVLKRDLMVPSDQRRSEINVLFEADRITPTRQLEYPWFHWFELLARTAREGDRPFRFPATDEERKLIWDFVLNRSQGIGTLIALRSHRLLSEFGVESKTPVEPERGGPLFDLYHDLRARPEELFMRAPY